MKASVARKSASTRHEKSIRWKKARGKLLSGGFRNGGGFGRVWLRIS